VSELLEDLREEVDDGAAHEVRVRQVADVRLFQVPLQGLPEDARRAPPLQEAQYLVEV
jgi:hypothetical protein